MFARGSLADKTNSTVHHTLNFVYTFWGIPANRESQSSNERGQQTWQEFLWPQWWETGEKIRPSGSLWQILSTSCFVASPLSMTPWLRAELQKGMLRWPIFRLSGRSEDLDGSKSCASVLSSFSWSLLSMVHFFTSLTLFTTLIFLRTMSNINILMTHFQCMLGYSRVSIIHRTQRQLYHGTSTYDLHHIWTRTTDYLNKDYQYTTSVDINNTRCKRIQSLIQNHMPMCAVILLESRE